MPTFVDSNILVYARDASEAHKQRRASAWMEHLWRSRSGRVSVQVLHEFYVVATRKLRPGLPRHEARRDVEALGAWEPVALDRPLTAEAWSLEDRFGLSFWDSLVVAAALRAGCERLLTEDLQDGQDYGGVVVCDPFAHPVDEADAQAP